MSELLKSIRFPSDLLVLISEYQEQHAKKHGEAISFSVAVRLLLWQALRGESC